MAETPPGQIQTQAQTPPTPLHGAAYDNLQSTPRRSARLSQRKISRELQITPEAPQVTSRQLRSVGTPASSHRGSPDFHLGYIHSPQPSPRHKSRRVQVLSPSSPDFAPAVPQPTTFSNSHKSLSGSTTTTMNEGMLPTPVKTPRQKKLLHANPAARALFQDQPVIGEEVMPSPRKGRKGRRYNGFTLESFSAQDNGGRVQVFTDSRDKVPEVDVSEENPFLDPPTQTDGLAKRIAGSSKRRKVSGESRRDPQVAQAIDKDEGMVYVFRGKKVYRKFSDTDEEEEVIDTNDLGLLEHTPNGSSLVKPLRTLTRRSVRPRRLFQSKDKAEDKNLAEEEAEEEAVTDVEDHNQTVDLPVEMPAAAGPSAIVDQASAKEPKRKVNSPFDSWKRVKAGATPNARQEVKGRKRGLESSEEADSAGKRTKAA